MIYLASPYSHPHPDVREQRYQAVVREAAALWKQGEVVFSPIAHSHPIALHGVSGAWSQWAEFDRTIIRACSAMWVLKLDGWDQSEGIRAEVDFARYWGIPVTFKEPLS